MSSMEEQFHMIQQQIAALQEQINGATTTPMQSADDTAPLPLHSMGTRPHYDWSPSEGLTELMNLDAPLHTSALLSDLERKTIIESYPPMAHLDYKAPATIPSAERMMNKGQRYEDNSLKQLQYLLSAVYRPLDILSHELVSSEAGNPNLERYCTMLRDVHKLLLHVGASMTHTRNNIALRAVNPSFSMKTGNEVNYTLPLDEFQNTLIQQTAARKATREATINKRQRRRFPNGNSSSSGSFLSGPDQQFFRAGPPSEQGGFPNNTNTNFNYNSNHSNSNNSSNNFRNNNFRTNSNNNSRKNTNPFRQIQFHTLPPTTTTPSAIQPFGDEQIPLIDQAIQDLLSKQAIEPVSDVEVRTTPGFYSSMFVIPKKDGGIRPVFNLKRLNQYLDAPHFKMETIREVALMINPNDYLVSIDLSDAFLHIGLHPESRRFLRLKWKDQVYQYCTTAFGLSTSPFVFSKVCRPILEHFRSQGYRISAYLDDWILAANTKQLAIQQAQTVVNLLQQLGWLINFKKSVLTPTQQLKHLGFVLNTKTMTASLPMKKLRDLRRSIKQILDHPRRQTPRVIHSVTMRIQATTFAIFPARLYTRRLLYHKNQTVHMDKDWDHPVSLDQESQQELQWWYNNLKLWNGRSFLPTTPSETVYVDASNTGWGCSWRNHRTHGYWTPEEAQQSINWRELKAAYLALQTFPTLRNTTVLIRTDNTTSMTYINKQGGTRSLPLMTLATQVWTWCLKNNIMLQAQYIQGIHNKVADFESRRQYFKNLWMIKPAIFQQINRMWGPYSVDLFADRTTRLLPKYVSWIPDPHAIHTDAFTIPWKRFPHPFINPPWNLITRVLHKIIQERLPLVTLVVPYWPSAIWFPLDASPVTTAKLDALRVEIIRNKLVRQNLNAQAVEDLLAQRLVNNGTNRLYRKNQLRFLAWATQHNVSCTAFTPSELVNFLADMRQEHNLQASTLKTLRTAVAHLHDLSTSISEDTLINSYLDTIAKQAPPVSIHRPTIDVSPALSYARTIASRTSTTVKLLQQKLVFLLAMAAFLRPSDLARIPFASCSILDSGRTERNSW
ncbi:hypothetical protein RO3G_13025 [Rhizopus delemar RA 99-880]|uniref:Reverse transcriptase domain-containing protein n=1 Tax=Rhizopus delemar (strain RA 99-880 / ATCC MYA-4621 / FGSC 9543 / NRRL 43880) TaxID=246409 RepID=I1CIN4_RHIO9|nr:hypothetical protein RO3G_13025 [Rhizopus delemar RA 99-880]|eukprot:EIE88314.1 hypothetical protein RO3G_13025 [Rhizopus delemar RA 99-880]